MIIEIYDAADQPTPLAQGLVDFLNEFRGPWLFEVGASVAEPGDYYEDDSFDPTTPVFMADLMMEKKSLRVEGWESLFDRIRRAAAVRKKAGLPARKKAERRFSILLTHEYNEFNWFSGMEPREHAPLGFIQTIAWHRWVESELMPPLLYECVALPLRYRMFQSAHQFQELSHKKPVGCVNDWCGNLEDVILRLQTGSLCSDCIDRAISGGLAQEELDQVDEMLDAIRQYFRAFNRRRAERKPLPVRIAKGGRRIAIGNHMLHLRPLEKALYQFFLKHREGCSTAELSTFEEKLEEIYSPLFTGSHRSDMKKIVNRLATNQDGVTHQTVSRINRAIDLVMIPELADHYKIQTQPDGLKKVAAVAEFEN